MEFGTAQDFPPTTGWPAPVAKLADELKALQDRKIAADRAVYELVGNETPGDRDAIALRLQKQDAATLADAARQGVDIATIGRPAAEQYERDVADARREVSAVTAALATVTGELLAAMRTHRTKMMDTADALTVEGHTAFTAAVESLPAARNKLYAGAALRSFVERATAANPHGQRRIIYTPNAPTELANRHGFNVPSWSALLEHMTNEADALDPRQSDDAAA